jgi:type IV secretory pathway VirB2 component (pilin)
MIKLIRNIPSASARFGRAAQTAMLAGGVGLLLASPAWEGPLDTVMQSLSGPVAKAVGIIAIVLTGLGFAFAEGGSAMRKGVGIVFGLAIAFTATTFVSTFFNLTAGAAF